MAKASINTYTAAQVLSAAFDPTANTIAITGGGGSTSDGGTFTAGTDTATPIEGVYEASPSTVTTGKYGVVGIDATRNIKATLATQIAGEDLTANRIHTEPIYSYATITTATTTTIKSGAGTFARMVVTGGTTGTIVIYDNTAASGTKIADFDTTNALAQYVFDTTFSIGLTIITSAATKITVLYR